MISLKIQTHSSSENEVSRVRTYEMMSLVAQVNLMPILSILSVLFTQDTCATGSSILTCEIRKEVFYMDTRALELLERQTQLGYPKLYM